MHDILHLQVAPHQEQFVASNAVSLAEAHFEPDLPCFRAIYAGDVPVGFLMLDYDRADETYNLWRFMIDAPDVAVFRAVPDPLARVVVDQRASRRAGGCIH